MAKVTPTEKEYNNAIKYAHKILDKSNSRKNILCEPKDIVHDALVLHGSISRINIRKVYYDWLSYSLASRPVPKFVQRLQQFKICKGCPEEGPLPIASFNEIHFKTGRVTLNPYCKKCHNKKNREWYEEQQNCPVLKKKYSNRIKSYYKEHPEAAKKKKKYNNEYYDAVKNDELFKQQNRKRAADYLAKILSDPILKHELKKTRSKYYQKNKKKLLRKQKSYYRKKAKKNKSAVLTGK